MRYAASSIDCSRVDPSRRPRRARHGLSVWLAAVLLIGGCASSGSVRIPPTGDSQAAGPGEESNGTPNGLERLWRIQESDLGTQRIFRARLRSPEGKGRFRLLLRLEGTERFRIDATHPLFNRRLWSLDVVGTEALLVDYLQKRHCTYSGEAEIPALPLGPFPFASLPALLLGYLPAEPAATPRPVGESVEFLDRQGRTWQADLEGGVLVRWSLHRPDSAPVDWNLTDRATLSAADEEIELMWRGTVTESSDQAIPRLEPGKKSESGSCDLGWIRGAEPDSDDLFDDAPAGRGAPD